MQEAANALDLWDDNYLLMCDKCDYEVPKNEKNIKYCDSLEWHAAWFILCSKCAKKFK